MKTKLSSKGQVVIPKAIRDELQLKPGDELEIRVDQSGGVRMEQVSNKGTVTLDQLMGCLHQPGMRARSVEEMHEAIEVAAHESWNHDRG